MGAGAREFASQILPADQSYALSRGAINGAAAAYAGRGPRPHPGATPARGYAKAVVGGWAPLGALFAQGPSGTRPAAAVALRGCVRARAPPPPPLRGPGPAFAPSLRSPGPGLPCSFPRFFVRPLVRCCAAPRALTVPRLVPLRHPLRCGLPVRSPLLCFALRFPARGRGGFASAPLRGFGPGGSRPAPAARLRRAFFRCAGAGRVAARGCAACCASPWVLPLSGFLPASPPPLPPRWGSRGAGSPLGLRPALGRAFRAPVAGPRPRCARRCNDFFGGLTDRKL